MEHQQHHDMPDLHSPRQQYELTDQLAHFEQAASSLEFQMEENPFSYYNEVNKRESVSSEDQASEEHSHHQAVQHAEGVTEGGILNGSKDYPSVEVEGNLAGRTAFTLGQALEGRSEGNGGQNGGINNKSDIKFVKEKEFDLSKLNGKQQSPKIPHSPKITNSPKIANSPKVQKQPIAKLEDSPTRKYEQQLHNDLEDLKNSLKGKQSKKKSKIFQLKEEAPKVNLNKTYAPATKSKLQNQSQMQQQQMRMLVKMAFQKKKANYEMLKEWDRKRAENMALHGKMIELLQNQIDLRIKSSLQNFQNYQTFFKEKARQEEKYVTSPVINTRYALQNNSLSKNVYINCSVILNSLCDENTNRCKKINDFIHLIRTNILKELTENHLSSSQKELLKVREKISTLKASLKKYNLQTEEKTVQLGNLFKQQSGNITNKCDKDFYRTQLSFLRKAIQQIEVQKKLGEYCLQYYHTAVLEELKRSNVIREAMVTYSRGLKETYNMDIEGIEIQQMSKNQELKLIEEYYSLQEMFDERTIELYKLKNHVKGDVSIDNFTKYIERYLLFLLSFNYQLFDSRIILLKEFQVKYITQSKSKELTEETCYLVITVDNFLHLSFNTGRNICCKPDITIKISHKWLQVKPMKDEFVDIVKKEEKRNSMMSYFWDNKLEKVFRVRFGKKDNKEEFMDYITKLMIDTY